MYVRASFVIENSVLIPLFTGIIVTLILFGMRWHDELVVDSIKLQVALKLEQENISDKNEDLLSGSVNLPDNKFAETDDNFDMDTEIAKIQHTSITFKQPTSEQLSQIQAKTYNSMSELKQHVQSVMSGDVSQDEINAMLLLKIAEMEVAITNEQTTN